MHQREFFWSFAKFSSLTMCKFHYRLKYHDSFGGWDLYAGKKKNLLYRLKKLNKISHWLENIIQKSILETLQNECVCEKRRKYFEDRARFLFHRDWHRFLSSSSNMDFSPTCLFELYYKNSVSEPQSIFETTKSRFYNELAKFADSSVFNEIAQLDYALVRNFKIPDSFVSDGFKVWVAPDLVWENRSGILNLLKIHFGNWKDSLGWDIQSALLAIFAMQKYSFAENRIQIRTVFLAEGNPCIDLPVFRPVCEIRRLINQSSLEMIEFEKSIRDGKNSSSLFVEKTDSCKKCEFRKFCID